MNDRTLPKLYAPVTIEFSSLRNGFGSGYGVIFDIDTIVQRRAMRVATKDGWAWQIIKLETLIKYDWYAATDQEILYEYESDIDVKLINTITGINYGK